MTASSHIINLMQSKIEIGADNSIYRKVNANTFQCLTCNDVLSMNTLDSHFQEDSHKKLFNVCCQSNLLTSDNNDLAENNAQECKPSPNTTLDNVQIPVEEPTKKDATLFKSTAQESKPSPNTTLDNVQGLVEEPTKKDATLFKSTAQESKPSPNTSLDNVQGPVEEPTKKDATLFKSTAQESKPSPNTSLDNVQGPVEEPTKTDATLFKSTAQESKPSPNTSLDNVRGPVEEPTKTDATLFKTTAQESKPLPNTILGHVQVPVKEPTKKDKTLFKSGFLLHNSAPKTDQKGGHPKKPQSAPIDFEKVTSEMDDAIFKALNVKDYIIDDDKGLKWCMLCDWVMNPAATQSHLANRHHQTILKMHREAIKKRQEAKNAANRFNSPVDPGASEKKNVTEIEKSEMKENISDIGETDTDREKILESLNSYEKNHITIDFLAAKPWAHCRKCNQHVDFNSKALDAHIEYHRKEVKPPNSKPSVPKNEAEAKSTQPAPVQTKKKLNAIEIPRVKEAAEMSKFAKDNNIHKERKKWHCKSCNVPLTSSLQAFKNHVDTKEHKEIVTVKIVKFKSTDYLTSIAVAEDNIYRDFIVNDKFVINDMSFMTILKVGSSLRCEACQLDLTDVQLLKHKIAPQHEQALKNTFVITSMEPDFIREIRTGVYHCGFCNVCFSNFEELESHLRSPLHKEARTNSEWRVQQYLPGLSADRKNQSPNRASYNVEDIMRMLGGDVFN